MESVSLGYLSRPSFSVQDILSRNALSELTFYSDLIKLTIDRWLTTTLYCETSSLCISTHTSSTITLSNITRQHSSHRLLIVKCRLKSQWILSWTAQMSCGCCCSGIVLMLRRGTIVLKLYFVVWEVEKGLMIFWTWWLLIRGPVKIQVLVRECVQKIDSASYSKVLLFLFVL